MQITRAAAQHGSLHPETPDIVHLPSEATKATASRARMHTALFMVAGGDESTPRVVGDEVQVVIADLSR